MINEISYPFAVILILSLITILGTLYMFIRTIRTRIMVIPDAQIDITTDLWIDQLKRAKKSIRIIAGELSPLVYENPKVLSLLREKQKKGVRIDIMFGPKLYRNANGTHALIEELLGKRNVTLIQLKEKRPPFHFRIIDKKFVYYEKPHKANIKIRDSVLINNSVAWSRRLWKLYDKKLTKGKTISQTSQLVFQS